MLLKLVLYNFFVIYISLTFLIIKKKYRELLTKEPVRFNFLQETTLKYTVFGENIIVMNARSNVYVNI